MSEHLLNIREAAEYLGIGERKLKELVDRGEIPAYRIGGAFLRFKEGQLAIVKPSVCRETAAEPKTQEARAGRADADAFKDFLYFNDFYILSIIIIVIAAVLLLAT